ncbi:MAG: hypothetical protein H5U38_00885 [Calditrichaeota bacterium]|nr:hypothetical protein [Calditrichota bacterium]
MEMTRALAAELAKQALAGTNASPLVVRRLPPAHAADWLLEQELVRVGQERQLIIYLLADTSSATLESSNEGVTALGYRVLAAGVKYEHSKSGLFRAGRVRRTVFLRAHFVASTLDGRVLWSGDLERQAGDSVAVHQVARLEDPRLPFTQAALPRARGLAWLVEPALVLLVTGTVTYLFYAYRSK